jgi:hypothetical protein
VLSLIPDPCLRQWSGTAVFWSAPTSSRHYGNLCILAHVLHSRCVGLALLSVLVGPRRAEFDSGPVFAAVVGDSRVLVRSNIVASLLQFMHFGICIVASIGQPRVLVKPNIVASLRQFMYFCICFALPMCQVRFSYWFEALLGHSRCLVKANIVASQRQFMSCCIGFVASVLQTHVLVKPTIVASLRQFTYFCACVALQMCRARSAINFGGTNTS